MARFIHILAGSRINLDVQFISMDTVTTIIVWATPAILGIASWALIELFKDVKEDVKELKTSNGRIRTDIAEMRVEQRSTDQKVMAVGKSVEDVRKLTHELDKRTANVTELNGTIDKLSARLAVSDQNYGKILMILDGMAKRIGINIKKSGS